MDKQTLLENKKRKLLHEIQYYERRIAEARNSNHNIQLTSDDGSDTDSDTAVIPVVISSGLSAEQLRREQEELQKCISATQELCDINVIDSEVNVLVEPPKFTDEPPVPEPGSWREVTAECSVDHGLVPFVISFFVHQPERRFAPTSFRGLNVKPVKSKHALELAKSVLGELARPSDAVEVLRLYAAAFRSRRETLARLHDKFGSDIVMAAKVEGGYSISCAGLLEVWWTLQNRFSPIAPFHHRLKFECEYMEEKYIKQITVAHRQLSEPDVDTEERTMLLATILGICLQARGETQELHESMSSDPEGSACLEKMRTTLDREPDVPGTQRRSKQTTIMAPPKTVPKKAKPKRKENTDANGKAGKGVKRSIQDGGEQSGKKSKVGDGETDTKIVENDQEIAKIIENIEKQQENTKNHNLTTKTVAQKKKNATENLENGEEDAKRVENKKKNYVSVKNKDQKDSNEKNSGTSHPKKKDGTNKNTETSNKVAEKNDNVHKEQINEKQKKISATNMATNENQKNKVATNAGRSESNVISSVVPDKNVNKAKSTQNSANKLTNDNTKKVIQGKVVKKVLNTSKGKIAKNILNTSKGKAGKVAKKVVSSTVAVQKPEVSTNYAKKADGATKTVTEPSRQIVNSTQIITDRSNIATTIDKLPNVSPIPKMVAGAPNKNPTVKKNLTNNNGPTKKAIADVNKVKTGIVKPKHTAVSKNLPLNPSNRPKTGNTKFATGKITKSGNTEKENKFGSKIPQKPVKSVPEVVIRINPLRTTPRKGLSKPGNTKTFAAAAKPTKPVSTTNIPRLVKPKPRVA